jgi:hypothetical protein
MAVVKTLTDGRRTDRGQKTLFYYKGRVLSSIEYRYTDCVGFGEAQPAALLRNLHHSLGITELAVGYDDAVEEADARCLEDREGGAEQQRVGQIRTEPVVAGYGHGARALRQKVKRRKYPCMHLHWP